jgi:quinol monooxygenase YgiN
VTDPMRADAPLSLCALLSRQLWSSWLPGFSHVLANEVGSLVSTYEGFFPSSTAGDLSSQAGADTEILAFETYSSESEFQRVHMAAPAVQQFLSEIGEHLSLDTSLNVLEPTGAGFHTRGAEREQQVRASGKKPFVLVVTLTLKDGESVAPVLDVFKGFAAYVKESEPQTLTYEAFRVKNRANELIIFERYVDAKDLTDVHWKSAEFAQLGASFAALGVITGKTQRTYEEAQVGHWGQE